MNRKYLTKKETMDVAIMLFGMFFGAGNLIFPVFLGQEAGKNTLTSILGFLVTGVGIPLLAIAALANSKSEGLQDLASHVSARYGIFFTALLYLTIGPFFAIPRCASTSFSTGIQPMLSSDVSATVVQWIFTLCFFAIVLYFSLKPGKILTYVGRIITPVFLVCLGLLLVVALVNPMGGISSIAPTEAYRTNGFFQGFLDGYNTMDALAGLAFGIVVVEVIRNLGVGEPADIAKNTLRSGCFSSLLMAVIYVMLAIIGAESRNQYAISNDGGEALHVISNHYFGNAGAILLSLIVTLACLKTAIGLITSCSETFEKMTCGKLTYRTLAVTFCVVSFLISNLGLSRIISYSVPVLMFLYPLAMVLIVLALTGKLFHQNSVVYKSAIFFTFFAAILDFLNALPTSISSAPLIQKVLTYAQKLPLFSLGLGWVCPAIIGYLLGLFLYRKSLKKG